MLIPIAGDEFRYEDCVLRLEADVFKTKAIRIVLRVRRNNTSEELLTQWEILDRSARNESAPSEFRVAAAEEVAPAEPTLHDDVEEADDEDAAGSQIA